MVNLELKGCILTIDAMGTQTQIAKKITKKQADSILALKSNPSRLYEDVRLYLEDYCKAPGIKKTKHYARHVDSGHGRREVRECYTGEEIGWLQDREK